MERLSESSRRRIGEALQEDVGEGDWTTSWIVPSELEAEAQIECGADGVVAGLPAAIEVFRQAGGAVLEPLVNDGDSVVMGSTIARLRGPARAILTGERVALNFLMRLSGVATYTRRFVRAVEGTKARITDTRKTTPLWRELERAATRAGGAVNHRYGLFDMVLIKDNHLACTGEIAAAVARVREANERGLRIEVEVSGPAEVEAALESGVDRILLDNMTRDQVADAVRRIRGRAPRVEIEASGGITLESVRSFAEAGVDLISVGALTHSAPALDFSLDLFPLST